MTEAPPPSERSDTGQQELAERLFVLVYDELRQLADAKLSRESAPQTLQPTALVHEVWLRLGGDRQPAWQNRRHFFGAAAEAMRKILIDRARRRQAVRHGGDRVRAGADALAAIATESPSDHLHEVGEALQRFADLDPAKAELVRLRYYLGMTLRETAAVLEISEPTAKRWWVFSRAWLAREIREQRSGR